MKRNSSVAVHSADDDTAALIYSIARAARTLLATGLATAATTGVFLLAGPRPAHAIHAVCSEVAGNEQAVLISSSDDCSNPFTFFSGGDLLFNNGLHTQGNLTTDGTTTAYGAAFFKDAAYFNGNNTFTHGTTTTFDGNAVFNGSVTFANSQSFTGITNTGNIATDTLSTTGLATLNSLNVTNNASVGGTLNVTGVATFNGITNTGNITTGTLTANTSITAPTVNATTVNATTVAATTVNATTSITAPTVNATTVNASTVAATAVNATTSSIGTANVNTANIGTANVATAFQVSSGANVNMGGNRVQNVAAPVAGSDAANKSYVDASVASLGSQVDQALAGVNTRLDDVSSRTTKATAGVAMAFAMAGVPTVLPTERVAVTMNYGNFQGQNGLAINGAVRLNDNFQLTGGVGYSTNQNLVGARAGLRVGW